MNNDKSYGDDVYYKIIDSNIVCLQWFDENDYNQDRFLKNKKGKCKTFKSRKKAKKYLSKL